MMPIRVNAMVLISLSAVISSEISHRSFYNSDASDKDYKSGKNFRQLSSVVHPDPSLNGIVSLKVAQNVLGARAGWPFAFPIDAPEVYTFGLQPIIQFLDMYGAVQSQFCPLTGPCEDVTYAVTATIFNNPGCAVLGGHTVAYSVNGIASFTDLSIDVSETNYTLKFSAGPATSTSPIGWAPLQVISDPFDVSLGFINLRWEIPKNEIPVAGTYLNTIDLRVLSYDTALQAWLPLTTYNDAIQVSIILPGCETRGGPEPICRNSAFGSAFGERPGVVGGNKFSVPCVNGNASVTDLSVVLAGSFRLIFESQGMLSQSLFFRVQASNASFAILVQQPPASNTAGVLLSRMPILNLVDMYNNSVSGDGFVVNAIVYAPAGQTDYLWTCLDPGCDFAIPFSSQAMDPVTGILAFQSVMVKAAGIVQIGITVSNILFPEFVIAPIRSVQFEILPGRYVAIQVVASPQSQLWTSADTIPTGATAGIPFARQPLVRKTPVSRFGRLGLLR
jgi:hypothetical protein